MKILLLMASPANANGGMEKHFVELANGLASEGHQITCVSAREHLDHLNASISKQPVNSKASRYNPALLYSLFKLLKENTFDIAHAQGSKAADILRSMSPFFQQTKFIATIHSFKSRYPNPKAFCRIIAVSKTLAVDIGCKKVTVIYNGLRPFSHVHPNRESNLPDNLMHPIWLAVGRLVPAKGFDRLVSAFQHVSGSLLIAGSGPESRILQEQIENDGLGHRVRLIGHRSDIFTLMKAVDGVVISSRREGFSYVFAEALITGKPIVSSDVPIANEFLPKSCIVPMNSSPRVFASFLNRDIEQISCEQQTARLRSKTELLFDTMIEKTLLVYSECLGN